MTSRHLLRRRVKRHQHKSTEPPQLHSNWFTCLWSQWIFKCSLFNLSHPSSSQIPGLIPHPIPDTAHTSISVLKNPMLFPLSSPGKPNHQPEFCECCWAAAFGWSRTQASAALTPCYFGLFLLPRQLLQDMEGLGWGQRGPCLLSGHKGHGCSWTHSIEGMFSKFSMSKN